MAHIKLLLYSSVVVTATVVVSSVLMETWKILYKIPMKMIIIWRLTKSYTIFYVIPLRFRKAGRVWCGGTRETHWATCHNEVTPRKTKEYLKSNRFLDLNRTYLEKSGTVSPLISCVFGFAYWANYGTPQKVNKNIRQNEALNVSF